MENEVIQLPEGLLGICLKVIKKDGKYKFALHCNSFEYDHGPFKILGWITYDKMEFTIQDNDEE